MIAQILRKWFGIEEPMCQACEILREELRIERHEKTVLLERILNPEIKTQPAPPETQEPIKPITPRRIPWAVRKQMLEQNDRDAARIIREENQKEITEIEKELGITSDAK